MCNFKLKYEEEGEIQEVRCGTLNTHWLANGSRGAGTSVCFETVDGNSLFVEDDKIISLTDLERCGGLKGSGFKVYKYDDGSAIYEGGEVIRNKGTYIIGSESLEKFHSIK